MKKNLRNKLNKRRSESSDLHQCYYLKDKNIADHKTIRFYMKMLFTMLGTLKIKFQKKFGQLV